MAHAATIPRADRRRSSTIRSNAVRSWALVLSVLAAGVATMLGIHSVGETVLRADTHATSSLVEVAAAAVPAAAVPTGGPDAGVAAHALTGVDGDALALGCGVLLLLCAVAAAVASMRARRQPADAGSVWTAAAPPALAVVGAATPAPSLIALGISRT